MKNLIDFLVLVTTLFLVCFNVDSQISNPDLNVSAVNRGCYLIKMNDSICHFLVELKLTNNSNSDIKFLTYSCATTANVVIDNKEFVFDYLVCKNNQITTIKLEAKSTFSLAFLVQTNIKNTIQTIRVGWNYVDFKNRKGTLDYHKAIEGPKADQKNVIWSNPIDLKYYNQNIYWISKVN